MDRLEVRVAEAGCPEVRVVEAGRSEAQVVVDRPEVRVAAAGRPEVQVVEAGRPEVQVAGVAASLHPPARQGPVGSRVGGVGFSDPGRNGK